MAVLTAGWHPGVPNDSGFWSFWNHLGMKKQYTILAWRCEECGFLELYAPKLQKNYCKIE
jgi:hypothetical protein